MKFDLKRPCKDCPFRKDVVGYLTRGRAREILYAIMRQDQTFTCHKTISGERLQDEQGTDVGYDPGDQDQHCAGALIMEKRAGWPNKMPRIAMCFGMFDPDELRGEDVVFESESAMIAHMED